MAHIITRYVDGLPYAGPMPEDDVGHGSLEDYAFDHDLWLGGLSADGVSDADIAVLDVALDDVKAYFARHASGRVWSIMVAEGEYVVVGMDEGKAMIVHHHAE